MCIRDRYKVMGTSYNAITAKGEGIITILVIIMLGLAVCFDLWKSKIPNWLTGMGVMTGYAAHIRGEGEKGIILVTVDVYKRQHCSSYSFRLVRKKL